GFELFGGQVVHGSSPSLPREFRGRGRDAEKLRLKGGVWGRVLHPRGVGRAWIWWHGHVRMPVLNARVGHGHGYMPMPRGKVMPGLWRSAPPAPLCAPGAAA